MEQIVGATTSVSPIPAPAPALVPSLARVRKLYAGDDKPELVCALGAFTVAPKGTQPPSPTRAKRQRRTFWTECAKCKKKNKYPIKDLSCQLVCPDCLETFPAIEVTRPRNQDGVASAPLSSSTVVIPAANVACHARKKVKRGIAHGVEVRRTLREAFPKSEMKKLLQEKTKAILEEKIKENMQNRKGS